MNVENTEDVTLTLLPNNKVDCQSASIDSWSYSKTTKAITFSSSDIYGESIILLLKSANFNHFLSYVTAEDISKYPDGGTHTDGYWYEKVVEGVDLLTAMGYTKIAVDKFTFTSRTTANSSKKISHSLGVEPKSVLLLSPLTYSKMQQFDILNGSYQNVSESSPTILDGSLLYANSNSGSFNAAEGSVHLVSGETTTKLYFNFTYYFKAGIEYTLITMA